MFFVIKSIKKIKLVNNIKFCVGLPKNDSEFLDCIVQNSEHIYEVYFSWGDFASGRSAQTDSDNLLPWELMEIQKSSLKKLSQNGIQLNLLFNANCYGKDSQSRAFFEKVGNTAEYIRENYGLASITTASPLIAKFFKNNFECVDVRASVNMEIGTKEGIDYLCSYFDSFYAKRELNRDKKSLKELSDFAASKGKRLFMLVNSGCLNNCSAHNFHDNLVAHEAEIAKMDNCYNFCGICHEYLKREENIFKIIDNTNFVRPEDIDGYDGLVVAAKLATRIHKNPTEVLKSYINRKYSGDVLRLLEPAHSIYPYVVENGNPLTIKKIGE